VPGVAHRLTVEDEQDQGTEEQDGFVERPWYWQ
jgi:hypothetical protein